MHWIHRLNDLFQWSHPRENIVLTPDNLKETLQLEETDQLMILYHQENQTVIEGERTLIQRESEGSPLKDLRVAIGLLHINNCMSATTGRTIKVVPLGAFCDPIVNPDRELSQLIAKLRDEQVIFIDTKGDEYVGQSVG